MAGVEQDPINQDVTQALSDCRERLLRVTPSDE